MFIVCLRVSKSPLHLCLAKLSKIIGKEIVVPVLLMKKMKFKESSDLSSFLELLGVGGMEGLDPELGTFR